MAAIAAAGVAAVLFGAGPAFAGLAPGITHDHNGEAGYYVNDSGGWRIRDAHSQVTVTAAMKDLNGTGQGAAGNELCDPNDGYAAQLGVVWTGSAFAVRYNTGTLVTSASDPCVEGGLLSSGYSQLLSGVHIRIGDVLAFDVYYNNDSGWLKFTASDLSQDTTRQAYVYVGWEAFYEAGIGVLSSNTPALTPPAADPVAAFTHCSFNHYNAHHSSHSVLGGWETKQAEDVNGGSQVVLSPNSSLNGAGDAFTVYEGGII